MESILLVSTLFTEVKWHEVFSESEYLEELENVPLATVE